MNIGKNNYILLSNGSKIHETAVVIESLVGSNSIVAPYAVINRHCEIGDNSIIGPFNVLEHDVKVGKNVTIGPHGVFAIGTIIEDDCFFGPHFSCANDKNISYGEHGTSKKKASYTPFPIKFEKGSRVGTRCTVGPGVTIGEGSKLDMCSFVIKDVKPFSHVRGSKDLVAKTLRREIISS